MALACVGVELGIVGWVEEPQTQVLRFEAGRHLSRKNLRVIIDKLDGEQLSGLLIEQLKRAILVYFDCPDSQLEVDLQDKDVLKVLLLLYLLDLLLLLLFLDSPCDVLGNAELHLEPFLLNHPVIKHIGAGAP